MDQELIASGWRPPTLSAERLVLRALEEVDAANLFHHASNPNVTRYTMWDAHRSIDDTKQFIIQHALPHYMEAIPEPIAICHRGDCSDIVGMIGCTWAGREHLCMELGYWIAEPYWGKGYAVESGRRLLDWIFANYTVNRIQAHCIAENVGSERVMEKLGMKYEGLSRSKIFRKGRYWDVKFYGLLRSDWEGR
jgi:RimJ/RimL family protein N-acetyltransferase